MLLENCSLCELSFKCGQYKHFFNGEEYNLKPILNNLDFKEEVDIMIVRRIPNSDDAKMNQPLSDKAGLAMRESLKKHNIKYTSTYLNLCRTYNDEHQTKEEIKSCSKYLKEQIKELKPKLIILFGKFTWDNFEKGFDMSFKKGKDRVYEAKNIKIIGMAEPRSFYVRKININKIDDFEILFERLCKNMNKIINL